MAQFIKIVDNVLINDWHYRYLSALSALIVVNGIITESLFSEKLRPFTLTVKSLRMFASILAKHRILEVRT